MDSCQPGQAIEPSAIEHQASPNISGNDLLYQVSVDDTRSSSPNANEESSKTKRKGFVPDRESQNKKKKKKAWKMYLRSSKVR